MFTAIPGSLHTSSAGSGVQFPLAAHTDIICCDGTSPGLHWKVTSSPSCELVRSPRDPRGGGVGGPQPTEGAHACTQNMPNDSVNN